MIDCLNVFTCKIKLYIQRECVNVNSQNYKNYNTVLILLKYKEKNTSQIQKYCTYQKEKKYIYKKLFLKIIQYNSISKYIYDPAEINL